MRSNSTRRPRAHSLFRRRHLAESLEPRLLLAGDPAEPNFVPSPAWTLGAESLSSGTLNAGGEGEQASRNAGSLAAATSFAQSLRAGVDELSRVIGAIGTSAQLGQSLPYVGSLLSVDVGHSAVIDTASIGELFDLSSRFESQIATPLRSFVQTHPGATAAQLVAQFSFLEAVPGIAGGVEGVRLNWDLDQTIDSSIAALLEPITGGVGGLIDAVDGDALATPLPIHLSASGLSFDVLRDSSDRIAVSIPQFSLDLSRAGMPAVDFAAGVGFLSGSVQGGEVAVDLGLDINLAGISRDESFDGSPLAGMASVQSLGEISTLDISNAVHLNVRGDGLRIELPFDFELPGFETGGYLPVFSLRDANPIDSLFPQFELQIPSGAPYSADALLGFHTLDATSLLTSLAQLGSVLGAWEQGSALNLPIPLAQNVTLGDALGLAESYGGAVTQFLADEDGLPAFGSVQELANLIPAISNVGPIESLVYDPETQQLDLSLEFFRQPDPIVAQANLQLIAGQENSPIASLQMTPGVSGIDNRLTITRTATLGMSLQLDLSPDHAVTLAPGVNAATEYSGMPALWTPILDILRRKELAYTAGDSQVTQLRLRDGSIVTMDLGRPDATKTLGDILLASRVYREGAIVAELSFDGSSLSVVDHSTPDGVSQLQILDTYGFFLLFPDDTAPIDTNQITGTPLASAIAEGFQASTPSSFFDDFADDIFVTSPTPLQVHLRDGTDVILGDTISQIFVFDLQNLLAAMSTDSGGVPVVAASYEDGRIVLTDLTEPTGNHTFRIEWAPTIDGAPYLGWFVPPGEDADDDGRIEGPQLIPNLISDKAPPVDASMTLDKVFASPSLRKFFGTEQQMPVLLTNTDGLTQVTVSTGILTPEMTLGELAGRMSVFSESGQPLVLPRLIDGRMVFVNALGGASAGMRAIVAGTIFEQLFDGQANENGQVTATLAGNLISNSLAINALSVHEAISSLLPGGSSGRSDDGDLTIAGSTTVGSVFESAGLTDMLGTEQQMTVLLTADQGLEQVTISTGVLSPELTLAQLASRMRVEGSAGETVIDVQLRDGRFEFNSQFGQSNRGVRGVVGGTLFEALFAGQILDNGQVRGDAGNLTTVHLANLSSQIVGVYATTTLDQVFQTPRLRGLFETQQEIEFLLTGSEGLQQVTVSTGVLTPETTLGSLAAQMQVSSAEDELLLRVSLRDGRLVFENRFGGNDRRIRAIVENTLLEELFGSQVDASGQVISQTDQLSTVDLFSLLGDQSPALPFVFAAESFTAQLLDGSQVSLDIGPIDAGTTIADLLDQLTIQNADGSDRIKARFDGYRIRLEDRTSPIASDSALELDLSASPLARYLFGTQPRSASGILDGASGHTPTGSPLRRPGRPTAGNHSVDHDQNAAAPDWVS